MQLDQIQWVYKLALVAERLLGRLPPSLAWIFLSGAIMIGIFTLCGWIAGLFISADVATSPIANGLPYVRDTKPYLIALTTVTIFGMLIYVWVNAIKSGLSTTSTQ